MLRKISFHSSVNRLRFSGVFIAVLFFTLIAHAQTGQSASPNIIFIIVDDQGYGDIGAFFQNERARLKDHSRPFQVSPNLDRLAREGAMFTQYYCAAPICAPSRSSLMLGVSQGHANVRDNQFDKALEDNYTMASTLKTLGYTTAAIGKWGLQGNDKYDLNGYQWPAHPLKRGFDYYFGYMRHSDGHEHYPKEALYRKYWAENAKVVWENYTSITQGLDKCYTTDLWTAMAKKYIVEQAGKKNDQPFFLYLAYDTPHAVLELPGTPYPQGAGLNGGVQWNGTPGHYINTAEGIPDSYIYPEYANAVYDHDHNRKTANVPWPDTYKRYATSNRRLDDAVGDITQLLRDLKIDSNTIVIYTSDNGPSTESYLPEEKYVPNRPDFFSSFGPFNGVKGDVLEGGVRLPAIAWWPGKIPANKKIGIPAIAYDWAPTLIHITGNKAPQRMDGISLLPVLTGNTAMDDRLLYIEYRNEDSTPSYPQFSIRHRNRARNDMQMLRIGNYAGLRYDIHSANDDFEIYDVVNDPKQEKDLAGKELKPGNLPAALRETSLQAYFKAHALQMRKANGSAPRPYDSAYIPAVKTGQLLEGITWHHYKGSFPWIPQLKDLEVLEKGHDAFPDIPADTLQRKGLTSFTGYISVPKDGAYHFYMSCDAKAFLRIHDIQVLDEDYAYPGNMIRTATLFLKAGYHPFQLLYYREEARGEPFLKLDWSGPGMKRQRMKGAVFFTGR